MSAKLFFAALAAFALAFTIQLAQAADEIHEGKVLSVSDGKITVFDNRDSDNDTFVVNAQTKITRNGKPAKLVDILAGDIAKIIAVSEGDKLIAKEIVAASAK
jgi:hypothetical protein